MICIRPRLRTFRQSVHIPLFAAAIQFDRRGLQLVRNMSSNGGKSNSNNNEAETTSQQQQQHTVQSPEKKRLWYDATIASLVQLTPTVTGVTIDVHVRHPIITRDQGKTWEKVNPPTDFNFSPGQWVDFYIPPINKIGGYSITSLPSHLPQLELAVKKSRHPPAAWVTSEALVGDAVKVRVGGEFVYDKCNHTSIVDGGACTVPSSNSGSLFVAGGVGINPLYGMLRQLHSDIKEKSSSDCDQQKAALLYSASTADELLFEPELSPMEAGYPSNFKMIYRVTKGGAGGDSNEGTAGIQSGRISSQEIGDALKWATNSTARSNEGREISSVYICGPPGMAKEIADACCKEHGVSRTVIHFEQWW